MKDTKAVQLLWQLPKNDWFWLEKYLNSPALSNHDQVLQLFKYYKYRFRRGLSIPDKEAIRARIEPQPTDAQIHHYSSYLYQAILDYLSWSAFQEDELIRDFMLTEAFEQRGLTERIPKVIRQTQKKLEKSPFRNAAYFRQSFELRWKSFNLSLRERRMKDFDVEGLNQTQDFAFLTERLKYACILTNHQLFVKERSAEGLLPVLLNYIQQIPEEDLPPALNIYWQAYQTMTGTTEEACDQAFAKLDDLLRVHPNVLTFQEQKDLSLVRINYCIRQINKSRFSFLRQAYDQYLLGIERGYLIENGILSVFTYFNVVRIGLKLKDFDGVKAFLDRWSESLPEEHRAHGHRFMLARYYYETGQLDRAQPILLQVRFQDLHHLLSAKILLLKILIEQEEWTLIEGQLRSFRNYLRRRGIQSYHLENYRNFAAAIKKMVGLLSNNSDPQKREKFLLELKDKKPLTELEWFEEQLRK